MPGPREQVVSLRTVEGINRLENQRVDDPMALYTAQNVYPRQPDMLVKRPGSALVVDGRTAGQRGVGANTPGGIQVPTGQPGITTASNPTSTGEATNSALTPVQVNVTAITNVSTAGQGGAFGTKPIALSGTDIAAKMVGHL